MPWERFAQIGLGILGMRPKDYWDLSLHEFYAATEGFKEFNSGGKPAPLSRSELDELMERYPD